MITKNNSESVLEVENLKHMNDKLKELYEEEKESIEREEKTLKIIMESLVEHGKDKDTLIKISKISKLLAEELNVNQDYIKHIGQASKVYDIGNMVISKNIYLKDEKLTFEEFNIVKNHTHAGYEILKKQHFISSNMAALISLQHHEWWNGEGYPQQLKGEEIDISARIVALADTVGALFHNRPGRKAWDFPKIVEYIEVRNNLQFDPQIVAVFMAHREHIHAILELDFSSMSL